MLKDIKSYILSFFSVTTKVSAVLILVNQASFSQNCVIDIKSTNICRDENVPLTYGCMDEEMVFLDVCSNDLEDIPVITEIINASSYSSQFGYKLIEDSGRYYGFMTGRGVQKILKLDFGTSLDNTPIVSELKLLNVSLNQPEDIDLIKIAGKWFVLVTSNSNYPANEITLVELESLDNDNTIGVKLGNFGITAKIRGISSYLDENGQIIIALTSSSNVVTLVNYRNSFENNIGPEHIFNFTISDAANLVPIEIVSYLGEWYILTASFGNSKIHKANLGNTLFGSTPSTASFNVNNVNGPFDLDVAIQGKVLFMFVSNLSNIQILAKFANFETNAAPSIVSDDTSNPVFTAFDIVHYNNGFIGHGIDFSEKILKKTAYFSQCNDYSLTLGNGTGIIKYSQSGQYVISVDNFDSGQRYIGGAIDTLTVVNSIAPDLDFSFSSICISTSVNFASENNSDNLTSYNWNFGDTNTSTSANPNHTYASAGEYTVTLEVTSSDGCGNFIQKDVTIYPEPAPAFNLPSSTICTNDTYLFENTTPGNYDGNISYEWFVNGVSVATTEDLSYEFPTGGAKEIKLVATIPGCSVESVQNISNVSVGPVAQFTVNDDCVGKALQFNNTSTGDITSTHWDFGNGFTSNLENPLFQYAAPGTYDVTLTLTNSSGCQTSKVLEVNVYELPDVQFTNDLSCEGTPTAFTDETTVGDANVASWKWSFDDPSSGNNTSTDRNPAHTFTTSGAFDVKLVAQTTNGCKDSVQQVVNVKQAPVADFEYDKLCINEAVQFTDTSEPVPGQGITTWSWDLGGVFSAEQNPEATFQFALDYNIGLTVTSENLCTSTTYKTVSVKPAPSISFGVEQACDNAEAHFFDTTDPLGDPITSRNWNFANQATSVDSSAYHAFNQVGNYDVSLTVMTENGCDYSVTESIQINEAPTAVFTPSVTFGAPPLDVEFTNQSVGADSFQWIFEEGNTSVIENPTYTFTEEDSYDVKLVASDENGCNDTITHRINVLYPDLDIVLTALNRNPVDATEVILTVGNNGTVTIDSFKASIDLGNQAVIEKVINQTLDPRVSAGAPVQSVNINLGFNINPQNLDYLCVTVTPIFEGLEESDLANNTKCINLSDNQTVILAPYPNPASNQLHLQIISNDRNSATIQLFSTRGDLVKNIEIDALSAGMNNVLINTADIDKGIYMIKASSGGKTAMYKVVVEN